MPPIDSRLHAVATLILSPVLAFACAGAPPDTAPPPATAHPAVTATPAATATASAAATVATETPATPSPFVVLHETDGWLELLPVDDAVLFQTKGALWQLDGDKVSDVTSLLDGLGDPKEGLDLRKSSYVLASLRGSLAGELRAHIRVGEDRTNVGRFFHRRGGKWQERKFGDAYMTAADNESWMAETDLSSGGRLFERYHKGKVLFEVDGPRPSTMPVRTKGEKGCDTKMVFHSLLRELPDGTLVGVGQACTGKDDRPQMVSSTGVDRVSPTKGPVAIEMWPKGEAKARFDILPGNVLPVQHGGIAIQVHGDAKDLWLIVDTQKDGANGGGPRLFHFDGTAWKDVSPACDLPLYSVVRATHTYTFCGDRAYRREGESWTKLGGVPASRVLFDEPMALGQDSIVALGGGALYRLSKSQTSFEKLEPPEVKGKKTAFQSMQVTPKGEVLLAAAFRGPGDERLLVRFVPPK